ncbi:hypothetical protein [Streptomyces sp. NPDC047000]|uniref:hypothetical protein n=1 Tax=Streptomyces sp. NPDC047000 TaxID=3155474 RepID=UPI0033D10007
MSGTRTHAAPGVRPVIGVDAGTVSLAEADHLVHDLVARLGGLPPGTVVCTHLVRTDERRGTVVSFAFPEGPDTATDADAVADGVADAVVTDADAVWERITGPVEEGGHLPPVLGAVFGERTHGSPAGVSAAALAAGEHGGRLGGRAVLYPGSDRLTGTVTVAEVLGLSAVERITVIGAPAGPGGPDDGGPDPATPVLTRDHVRPEWRDGRLTLALVPAVGGTLAPFEVPDPTPCCADHA